MEPAEGLAGVLANASPVSVELGKVALGGSVSLPGGLAVPPGRNGGVASDAEAEIVGKADCGLTAGISLGGAGWKYLKAIS
ncbi:MAG: hypothetical protein ROO76_14860 [Terriglobia bacterium]|nr:hypothetical protein [Terriglobia bacterium]